MGMGSPDNRRKADDSYRTHQASVGAIPSAKPVRNVATHLGRSSRPWVTFDEEASL